MVLGLGTDLIEVKRIERSIERFGARFLERVFSEAEIAYCAGRPYTAAERFAARFAAKEAASKALGTGISQGVTWREIEVGREAGGRPRLVLHGRAAERAQRMGVRRSHLSLSHTQGLAIAVVVLED